MTLREKVAKSIRDGFSAYVTGEWGDWSEWPGKMADRILAITSADALLAALKEETK